MTLSQLEEGVVLTVDKPYGWTSFQVVNKIKWQIKRELGVKRFKIGHAGTLDPLATGLLLICVGKATRQIEALQQYPKTYTGSFVFGATTPCFDLERAIDHFYPWEHISESVVKAEAAHFLGAQQQEPPLFSAVKIDGERAYQHAREGNTVALRAKPIEIYRFDINTYHAGNPELAKTYSPLTTPPSTDNHALYRKPQGEIPVFLPQADFTITCSKGTYIRSIARDLGIALGSGAFLGSLRREQIGPYTVDQALPIASEFRVPLP